MQYLNCCGEIDRERERGRQRSIDLVFHCLSVLMICSNDSLEVMIERNIIPALVILIWKTTDKRKKLANMN